MAMAVERVLFQVNTRTAMSVGQASGLALALAGRAGVPVVHYSPNEVKLAVAGDGAAGKYEVQQMVTRLLQLADVPDPPDAADALALALLPLVAGPARRRRCRARRPRRRAFAAARRGRGWRRPSRPRWPGRRRGDRVGAGHRDRAHRRPARCWSRSGASGTGRSCRPARCPRCTRATPRSCSPTCTCVRTRWCSTASRRATSATPSRR